VEFKNFHRNHYKKSAHERLFYGSPTTRIDGNRSKDRTFFRNTVLSFIAAYTLNHLNFIYYKYLLLLLNEIPRFENRSYFRVDFLRKLFRGRGGRNQRHVHISELFIYGWEISISTLVTGRYTSLHAQCDSSLEMHQSCGAIKLRRTPNYTHRLSTHFVYYAD